MGEQLDGRAREILAQPNYATISIARIDGSVQSVVAWIDVDGDAITCNSAQGRAWPAALQRSGQATITALADGNPMEWVSVATTLVEATEAGAEDHIHQLAQKYTGSQYPLRDGEQRIRFVLAPERVFYMNMNQSS